MAAVGDDELPLGHRSDLELNSHSGALSFRGRCDCGWHGAWYPTSGMAAADIGHHTASAGGIVTEAQQPNAARQSNAHDRRDTEY